MNTGLSINTHRRNWWYICLLLLACLWSALLSQPFNIFSPCSFSSDADLYRLIGKAMFQGQALYVDIWDHKGPLIFMLYGLADLIDSHSFLGLLLIQALVLWGGLIASYKMACLFLQEKAARIIPFLLPFFLGELGANPSELLLPLQIYSLYLFLDKQLYHKTRRILPHLAICSGIAFFTKYNICAFWLPLILVELCTIFKTSGIKQTIKELALSGLSVLPLFVLIFSTIDAYALYDSYFLFNITYGVDVQSILLSPPLDFFHLILTSILPL